MALILKESSTLQEQAKQEWLKLGVMWAIVAMTFLVPFFFEGQIALYLLPFILAAVVMRIMMKSFIIIRGNLGEKRVFNKLRELPNEYFVLNDITISVDGKEAQLDHILISPYGIWSVETKSHFGWIYGKEKDRNWTQRKKSESGKIYSAPFYNPVAQNVTHCKRLSDFLIKKTSSQFPVKSVVVFTSADKLIVETQTPVVTLNNLNETIRKHDNEQCLSQEQIKKVVSALKIRATSPKSS